MQTVGVGMIGSGFMGLTYSAAITGFVKGANLVAVAGGRRAPEIATEFHVPAESSIEALLARKDVDAVVLATPAQRRAVYGDRVAQCRFSAMDQRGQRETGLRPGEHVQRRARAGAERDGA